MQLRWLIVLLVLSGACAAPSKPVTNQAPQSHVARLPVEEINAIAHEIRAALPPVDKDGVIECTSMVDESNRDPEFGAHARGEAARCLRSKGALGAAIKMWTFIVYNDAGGAFVHEAL